MRAQDELDEYTRGLIAERRSKPADDLLTDLIAAEEAGDKLSNDELVMMVNAVIVGGTDTTRNQLGCAVALFAEHPEQWALLAEQPELAPRAVEEAMRYFGAVRGTARFASCDIEYRDVVFPAGTFISVGLAEANRDAAVFADPERSTSRSDGADQPQLTFGSGIHYCLGAALARAELQEALPLLARRMPNLRLDGRHHVEARGCRHLRSGAHADHVRRRSLTRVVRARVRRHGRRTREHERSPALVAHQTGLHAVHHVGDGHAVVEVVDDHRAAPAAPEADPPIAGMNGIVLVGRGRSRCRTASAP